MSRSSALYLTSISSVASPWSGVWTISFSLLFVIENLTCRVRLSEKSETRSSAWDSSLLFARRIFVFCFGS